MQTYRKFDDNIIKFDQTISWIAGWRQWAKGNVGKPSLSDNTKPMEFTFTAPPKPPTTTTTTTTTTVESSKGNTVRSVVNCAILGKTVGLVVFGLMTVIF